MDDFGFMTYCINEVPDHFKKQGSYIETLEKCAWLLKYAPDNCKTQEMCNEAVFIERYSLVYVPDHFKTQEICNETVRSHPYTLKYVPDNLKTQEMYDDAVHKDTWLFEYVRYWFTTQETGEQPVKEDRDSLIHVPDWFVVAQEMWYINYSHVAAPEPWGNDNWAINWYQGYKKRKAQKAKTKNELILVAWHPSRWQDWCVPEDEKRVTEKQLL